MTMPTQPTPGSEWRKPREEGYVVELPTSGHCVRLRPVALDVLIASGQIPDILTPTAAKILWEGPNAGGIAEQSEIDRQFLDMVSIVVQAAMLEPRIVDDPQADDEISLSDLDFGDKVTIYQLAIQPAGVLRRFRDRQAANVDALSDSQDDGEPAEPASEDS